MPPPLPSSHRGMTANPLKPVSRYRPGKPITAEDSSSEEEDEEENVEAQREQEQERRRQAEAQRRRQQAPSAKSFPAAATAASHIAKGVQGVNLEEDQDEDEDGFVTEEEEDDQSAAVPPSIKPAQKVTSERVEDTARKTASLPGPEESEEEEEEEESSEEESSSEDEAPRRVLLRPTFIKKDKRGNTAQESGQTQAVGGADSAADEAQRAQRQEKADMLIRDQLEKDAIARSAGNRAWDDDELVEADEEGAIDDRDGVDEEAEHAAWKLRELKRIKREREAIEEAEKEREEIERRRNLTAEERDREDREFLAKQKEEREANRGQSGFMQRYFHKGAFFRDDLEREGLDRRNIMGARFADDVARDTLPQYMQVRDMTKLGKKGRTRYRDLKTEDTGRFGDGYENRFRTRRDGPPAGITDERFLPDRAEDRAQGPTGANASAVRPRRRSRSPSASARREHSERSPSGDRSRAEHGRSRKRSPSPYDDRDKRRRVEAS